MPHEVHKFDPCNVPTVYDVVNGSTSLEPAIAILRQFITGLSKERDEMREMKREEEDGRMEF